MRRLAPLAALVSTLFCSFVPAQAEEEGWYVLVQDHGCSSCRIEVFVDHQLAVLQWSGETDRVARIDGWLAPTPEGRSEVLVFVRGPEGKGKMSVRLGRAQVRDGVVIFARDARRYALHPEPMPSPLRLRVPPGGDPM
ncbi:MAG: hypothetical protein H6732_08785 [Alphaproteobacteria bacterium]|nr:hypothetical protein [Alphaproteobacteria bacterium]